MLSAVRDTEICPRFVVVHLEYAAKGFFALLDNSLLCDDVSGRCYIASPVSGI